jgi:O-antigen/teichoic acid export membrane protein
LTREERGKERSVARTGLESVTSIALRGITLAAKFFLLVYLAKVLSPEEVGIYGLFSATISYSLYLLGLDFYTYAQREMLALPRSRWGSVIRDQFMFYGAVYLLMFPVLAGLFAGGVLPYRLAGWFYLILTLEHLSQELYRLLVVCGRVMLANFILFLRGAAWIYLLAALSRGGAGVLGLSAVWGGWAAGVAASVVVGVVALRGEVGSFAGRKGIDWRWARRGLKVAALFLMGTLALRGVFTFDRYLLDLHAGKAAVGVYSFFMALANALMAFTEAGAVSRLYPAMVAACRTGRADEYRRLVRTLLVNILVLNLSFLVLLFLGLEPLLRFVGKAVYVEQTATLWILVSATAVYCLGLVPHYALYARGGDRGIAIASVVSFLVFWVAAALLTPALGMTGMAWSVFAGVSALAAVKLSLCCMPCCGKGAPDLQRSTAVVSPER